MSFRLTCIEVPTDNLDLSSDIAVRELQIGSEPLSRHIWIDSDSSSIHWSKSRQADSTGDHSTLAISKILTAKSENDQILAILTSDNVHRFEFDDSVAKDYFLSQINGCAELGSRQVLSEGNGQGKVGSNPMKKTFEEIIELLNSYMTEKQLNAPQVEHFSQVPDILHYIIHLNEGTLVNSLRKRLTHMEQQNDDLFEQLRSANQENDKLRDNLLDESLRSERLAEQVESGKERKSHLMNHGFMGLVSAQDDEYKPRHVYIKDGYLCWDSPRPLKPTRIGLKLTDIYKVSPGAPGELLPTHDYITVTARNGILHIATEKAYAAYLEELLEFHKNPAPPENADELITTQVQLHMKSLKRSMRRYKQKLCDSIFTLDNGFCNYQAAYVAEIAALAEISNDYPLEYEEEKSILLERLEKMNSLVVQSNRERDCALSELESLKISQ